MAKGCRGIALFEGQHSLRILSLESVYFCGFPPCSPMLQNAANLRNLSLGTEKQGEFLNCDTGKKHRITVREDS